MNIKLYLFVNDYLNKQLITKLWEYNLDCRAITAQKLSII